VVTTGCCRTGPVCSRYSAKVRGPCLTGPWHGPGPVKLSPDASSLVSWYGQQVQGPPTMIMVHDPPPNWRTWWNTCPPGTWMVTDSAPASPPTPTGSEPAAGYGPCSPAAPAAPAARRPRRAGHGRRTQALTAARPPEPAGQRWRLTPALRWQLRGCRRPARHPVDDESVAVDMLTEIVIERPCGQVAAYGGDPSTRRTGTPISSR
jgi:hypothetical protein